MLAVDEKTASPQTYVSNGAPFHRKSFLEISDGPTMWRDEGFLQSTDCRAIKKQAVEKERKESCDILSTPCLARVIFGSTADERVILSSNMRVFSRVNAGLKRSSLKICGCTLRVRGGIILSFALL